MQHIYEQMHEQYQNKKSREAFIQLPMQRGAAVRPIIYIYIILYMKKDRFTDNAPYNPVCLIVPKIQYYILIKNYSHNLIEFIHADSVTTKLAE